MQPEGFNLERMTFASIREVKHFRGLPPGGAESTSVKTCKENSTGSGGVHVRVLAAWSSAPPGASRGPCT